MVSVKFQGHGSITLAPSYSILDIFAALLIHLYFFLMVLMAWRYSTLLYVADIILTDDNSNILHDLINQHLTGFAMNTLGIHTSF